MPGMLSSWQADRGLMRAPVDRNSTRFTAPLSSCGSMIFSPQQGYHCGGSGCGCSAVLLAGHVLPELEQGAVKRVLFLSTGALMSPLSACQGESIPGIAHAISLVYQEG